MLNDLYLVMVYGNKSTIYKTIAYFLIISYTIW